MDSPKNSVVSPEVSQALKSNSKEIDFGFFVPLDEDLLAKSIKSENNEDPKSWKVGGLASCADSDLDGETVDPFGIMTDYALEYGYINWNHEKGPDSRIGILEKINIDSRGLYIEGYLLKGIQKARDAYILMKELTKLGNPRRLGWSIEGKVIQQDGTRITKSFLVAVALTTNPVNPQTYAELMKSLFALNKSEPPEVKTSDTLKGKDDLPITPTPIAKSEDSSVNSSASSSKNSSASSSIPKEEIKEHAKKDKKQFEKIARLADEISSESKKLIEEDEKDFEKTLASGYDIGDAGPSGPQTGGNALRKQSMEPELKILTNDEKDEEYKRLLKYTMAKGMIADPMLATKVIKYAMLLQVIEEKKNSETGGLH